MTIYEILLRVIGRGGHDAAGIKNKMDLYVLYDRITIAEYNALMALMAA